MEAVANVGEKYGEDWGKENPFSSREDAHFLPKGKRGGQKYPKGTEGLAKWRNLGF